MNPGYLCLLDPSICSKNAGDQFITEAVQAHLSDIFKNHSIVKIPTQDRFGYVGKDIIRQSDNIFVGGTNLLTSQMLSYRQWKVGLSDRFVFKKRAILMGVGWWQYQNKPDLYTRTVLQGLLSKDYTHSVRDSYTEKMLHESGFSNVINTSCPTVWNLTPSHTDQIPCTKADAVLCTVTDYNPERETDLLWLRKVSELYDTCYFWPQGSGDIKYFKSLEINHKFKIIPAGVYSLDTFLSENGSIDYVGTRLHAGIRALQQQKRSLILSIDNRTLEIAKDTNLPAAPRKSVEEIHMLIEKERKTVLTIPDRNIEQWKNQFS